MLERVMFIRHRSHQTAHLPSIYSLADKTHKPEAEKQWQWMSASAVRASQRCELQSCDQREPPSREVGQGKPHKPFTACPKPHDPISHQQSILPNAWKARCDKSARTREPQLQALHHLQLTEPLTRSRVRQLLCSYNSSPAFGWRLRHQIKLQKIFYWAPIFMS